MTGDLGHLNGKLVIISELFSRYQPSRGGREGGGGGEVGGTKMARTS